MLPWHQRTSRRMNSVIVGGFSSQPRSSSGSTRTSIAGAAHQHRLDLIVAEDVPAEQAAPRQHRQFAVLGERLHANDGVVAPVRTAIALPPRAAERERAHAEPHAELKQTRERARRRQADDQRLQDAELADRSA